MKKNIIKICSFLLVAISVCVVKPLGVHADEPETGIGFSVAPILPSAQIDKNLGYFYLETKPGEEQTIEVKLSSQKKEKQTIQMLVQDAYTGTNGALDFGVNGSDGFEQDKTLKNPVSDIIKPVSETIELDPGEEKIVSFKVNPPKEAYEGIKLGHLVFLAVDKEKEGAIALKEVYQYGVTVILSENGDDYNDGNLKDLVLNEVKATVKRGSRLVTANVQNPNPKRLINLEMLATVTKKGDDKVIKQTKIPEFQFAPNSNVDIEVDWGLSELQAGEYTLNLSFKNEYDENRFTKDFRITGDMAKKLNKESAFKIKTPTWVKVVAVVTGVTSLGISIFILRRNKKWMKLARKKRNGKKRSKKK